MTSRHEGEERPPPKSNSEIDENLRRVYRDMVDSEIPPRFTELLEKLRQQDGRA